MAKYKPWLKMWVEWVDDVKMLALTLAEQGAWWRLCALAQKCVADGALVKGNGSPLSLDEITDAIRIKTKADRKVFDSMVQKMSEQGSLHWNSNTLVITHFADRQAKTASETPEAVRDRVRRYREKHVTENPLPPLQEREDIDIEEEEEEEGNGEKSVTSDSRASVKRTYGEAKNVYLTEEELTKLHKKFGVASTEDRINALSLYKGSKGKKYASDYLTILNWERMRDKEKKGAEDGRRGKGVRPKPDQQRVRPIRRINGQTGKER